VLAGPGAASPVVAGTADVLAAMSPIVKIEIHGAAMCPAEPLTRRQPAAGVRAARRSRLAARRSAAASCAQPPACALEGRAPLRRGRARLASFQRGARPQP